MISSCAARLAIGITLVSLYMCVYLTHQSSVPYLTTPFTWRTNSVAEVLGTESITNISTGDLLRKLRCDQDIVYDAVTSWTGSNVSPSCTCIHEKIVVPTVAGNGPSQEDMRRIILRCLLNKHSSEIEYAMSWNSEWWVTNPMMVVAMWNVVGLIYGTLCCVVGYYDKQQRASTSAYVVTSVSGLLGMCSIFLFLIPLYNIPYWSACFTKTLLFFLYTLVVLSQAQYKKDILQFWFFSALLAYALHYSFTLYNTYRFVRDASTSVVYALCCFALATNWTACSLAKKNWKGQKDEYKNEKLLHITCCVAFNVLLVCMMFLAMFPSYDPLLYEPDVYLGDNSGGFSIYRASQPALFVLLSILPTSVLCQQETAVEISSWVELLCRSIVTIAACMDLFWLERVPS